MKSTVGHVADLLKNDGKATLLIGAGCSVSAGIPTGAGFVKRIETDFKSFYDQAGDKTYPACMAKLPQGKRRELVGNYVDKAQINWAHIAIAQLMKNGFIDRILTTNFDNLVVRACALVGEFPATYDIAASSQFKPGYIPEKAVFHLHGQHTGFALLNTEEETRRVYDACRPIFADCAQKRVLIVVGYSGDNDGVSKHLMEMESYDYGLYWVGYEDNLPSADVQEKILTGGKDAHLIQGHDADGFFIELAQKLKCLHPQFIAQPFHHLKAILGKITEYKPPNKDDDMDAIQVAQRRLDKAITNETETPPTQNIKTKPPPPNLWEVQAAFIAGDDDKVIALCQDADVVEGSPLSVVLSSAHFNQGCDLVKAARLAQGEDAAALYRQAIEKFQAAQAIKPDDHQALGNWGQALADLARLEQGEDAAALRHQAIEKFKAALAFKPDMHQALDNWGLVLADLAGLEQGEDEAALYRQAIEKYHDALKIKPDYHPALSNWGVALLALARLAHGEDAAALFVLAKEKCLAANQIKPGFGSYSLACIAALKGEEEGCRKWLEDSRDKGENFPGRAHIMADKDFYSIRERPWFTAFLDSLEG